MGCEGAQERSTAEGSGGCSGSSTVAEAKSQTAQASQADGLSWRAAYARLFAFLRRSLVGAILAVRRRWINGLSPPGRRDISSIP